MIEPQNYRATILPVPKEVKRPLWSVMIPTYNCAGYLHETLSSVLSQAPEPEVMQIAVIDDCSTQDDPQAVVEELGQGRVEFYQQNENVGNTKNYATCLHLSCGTLIHLLHGDDLVKDGFYVRMQQAFETLQPIGAAFCRQLFIDGHGKNLGQSDLEQLESGVLNNWLERISTMQIIQTPSIVVRRDVYEQLEGFDERLNFLEDWEMWIRIASYYPIWYETEPLAIYRRERPNSLTIQSRKNGKNIAEINKVINICQSYLPLEIKKTISKKARMNWASLYLEYVLNLLNSGRRLEALSQLKEIFLLYPSFPFAVRAISTLASQESRRVVRKILSATKII